MTLEEAAKTVGFVSACIALGVTLWKGGKHVRAVRAVTSNAKAAQVATLDHLTKAIDALYPLIQEIQQELREAIHEVRDELALERAARRVMTSIPSFEYRQTSDGNAVVYVSPAYVHLTGLSREDTEDDGWLRCVAPEDRERVSMNSMRALESGKVFTTTYTIQHVHTYKRTQVEHTGTPVYNSHGECVGWVGVLRHLGMERRLTESIGKEPLV